MMNRKDSSLFICCATSFDSLIGCSLVQWHFTIIPSFSFAKIFYVSFTELLISMCIATSIGHIRWCLLSEAPTVVWLAGYTSCVVSITISMGFQRKIPSKRTVQASEAPAAPPLQQMAELRSLKLKRFRDDKEEADEGGLRPLTPTVNGGAGQEGPQHCPPAPKKPRLVLGCSLDGFRG